MTKLYVHVVLRRRSWAGAVGYLVRTRKSLNLSVGMRRWVRWVRVSVRKRWSVRMRVSFRVFYGFHEILGFCAFIGFREVLGFFEFLGFCELCGFREFLGFITSSELTELGHVSTVLIYVVNFLKKFRLLLKFERKNNIRLICIFHREKYNRIDLFVTRRWS
jgi:hypothetical protein